MRALVASAACFVALYSLLPHKELRFIFPALPALNVAAACAVARAYDRALPPPTPGPGRRTVHCAKCLGFVSTVHCAKSLGFIAMAAPLAGLLRPPPRVLSPNP